MGTSSSQRSPSTAEWDRVKELYQQPHPLPGEVVSRIIQALDPDTRRGLHDRAVTACLATLLWGSTAVADQGLQQFLRRLPPIPAPSVVALAAGLRDTAAAYITTTGTASRFGELAIDALSNTVLNVAAGGTLIQDIASQVENPLKHRQDAPTYHASHTVGVESPSILWEIFGKEELGVNTFHHQAVKDLGEGLRATAWAPDGVNEAFEGVGDPFVLSVQWHPERMIDGEMLKIFERFVEEIK